MKLLQYTDKDGFKRQSWVRDGDTNPKYGIPHNLPDLSHLQLSQKKLRELHNELFDANLITHLDVLKSGSGVTAILRRLKLKHLRQKVLLAYKLKERS